MRVPSFLHLSLCPLPPHAPCVVSFLSVSLSLCPLLCARPAHTLHPYKPFEGEGEGHRRPEVGFPVEHGFEDAAHGFEWRSVGEGVSRVTPSALRHRRHCGTPQRSLGSTFLSVTAGERWGVALWGRTASVRLKTISFRSQCLACAQRMRCFAAVLTASSPSFDRPLSAAFTTITVRRLHRHH